MSKTPAHDKFKYYLEDLIVNGVCITWEKADSGVMGVTVIPAATRKKNKTP